MLKLNGCSFIGVDKNTKFEDLVTFGKMDRSFEFLEFGILYSKSKMGTHQRYPSKEYVEAFVAEYDKLTSKPFYISIHLCGSVIDEYLNGDEELVELVNKFDRVQLNFKADPKVDLLEFFAKIETQRLGSSIIPIIQANKSKKLYVDYMEKNREGLYNIYHILFDGSGGFGRVLENPEKPIEHFYCGYAGGLGPETIRTVIEKIEAVVPVNEHYYVDMESQIRTENIFDLAKCKQVMDIIANMDEVGSQDIP